MEIKGFAQNLAEYMSRLSQKYYGKSWVSQFEFELWRDVREGAELIEDQEAHKLKDLSDTCQGWIRMNYSNNALEYISLDNWREFYHENSPF